MLRCLRQAIGVNAIIYNMKKKDQKVLFLFLHKKNKLTFGPEIKDTRYS